MPYNGTATPSAVKRKMIQHPVQWTTTTVLMRNKTPKELFMYRLASSHWGSNNGPRSATLLHRTHLSPGESRASVGLRRGPVDTAPKPERKEGHTCTEARAHSV